MLRIDTRKTLGPFRPINGVNGGTQILGGSADLTKAFQEMAIPITRLHDIPFIDPDTVDIHCLFPDFERDPEDPSAYRFEKTDEHIKPLIDAGIKIIFRLGESIEHSRKKYHVHPPADFQKWARICAHVIRHYNQGWADGFHWDIQHWEIWNEPDMNPQCWTGSLEQYCELYGQVAPVIREIAPEVKVGGPALAHDGEFFRAFLLYCRDQSLPLDFVSWHVYGNEPRKIIRRIEEGLELLSELQLQNVETHLTEWNYVSEFTFDPMQSREVYARTKGIEGATFTASTLALMQETDLDLACYYTATGGIPGRLSMFDRYLAPHKPFYVFKAFASVSSMSHRIAVEGNDRETGLALVAGGDDKGRTAILLSNFAHPQNRHSLQLKLPDSSKPFHCREWIIDDNHDFALDREQIFSSSEITLHLDLPAPSVRLLIIEKQLPE